MTEMTPLGWGLAVVAGALILAMLLTIGDHLLMELQIWRAKHAEDKRRKNYIGRHSCDGPTAALDRTAVEKALEAAEVTA